MSKSKQVSALTLQIWGFSVEEGKKRRNGNEQKKARLQEGMTWYEREKPEFPQRLWYEFITYWHTELNLYMKWSFT